MNLIEDLLKENKSFSKDSKKNSGKKRVVKESEMTIEDIISDAKRHAERYILEKNLEEKGYYAVCYAVLENKGRMVTTGVDMYINSPVFIAYSPEDYESFVNNYKGVFDESPSDYKFYTIYNKSYVQEGLDEDTVKKSNGKWTNRGDDSTEHGEFNTKKQADAQRKAMYANGYKGESKKGNNKMSVKKLKESKEVTEDFINQLVVDLFDKLGLDIYDTDPDIRFDELVYTIYEIYQDHKHNVKEGILNKALDVIKDPAKSGIGTLLGDKEKEEEILKEGYSDGTVSTSEIMDAINSLEELVEMMDDAGVGSIHASPSTYGLGQYFIGFPGGFINYNDVYSYVGEDEEDEEYYEESLKESKSQRLEIGSCEKGYFVIYYKELPNGKYELSVKQWYGPTVRVGVVSNIDKDSVVSVLNKNYVKKDEFLKGDTLTKDDIVWKMNESLKEDNNSGMTLRDLNEVGYDLIVAELGLGRGDGDREDTRAYCLGATKKQIENGTVGVYTRSGWTYKVKSTGKIFSAGQTGDPIKSLVGTCPPDVSSIANKIKNHVKRDSRYFTSTTPDNLIIHEDKIEEFLDKYNEYVGIEED